MIEATVSTALANLQAAIGAAGTLQGASQSAMAPVLTAVDATLAAIDANAALLEAEIDQTSVGGIHVGMAAPLMIAKLVEQAQAATDLSTLHTTRGYVARIGANIQNQFQKAKTIYQAPGPKPPPPSQSNAIVLGMP